MPFEAAPARCSPPELNHRRARSMLFSLVGLLPALLVPNVPPREAGLSRRSCVGVGALAALSCLSSPLPAHARMSAEEMDARGACQTHARCGRPARPKWLVAEARRCSGPPEA